MNLCFQNAEANSKKIQAENQRQKAKIRKLEQTVAEKTKKIEEQEKTNCFECEQTMGRNVSNAM